MQKEFDFVKKVEKEQIKKENDNIIKFVIKLQEHQKKFTKYNKYLNYRINSLLQKVR